MPLPTPSKAELRDILAFYQEAGVDCAIEDEALNRLIEEPEPVPAPPAAPRLKPPLPLSSPAPEAASAGEATVAARDAAAGAATLDALRALMEAFDGCALKSTASRLVFADGNPLAKVMFVGEAPGRDEDIAGLPFVGRSGKLLDLMLGSIGLDRNNTYIANVIPWRPPGNRTPTPQETQICLPFIRRQIELVGPDVLVCLGSPSTQALLNTREGIMRVRGKWIDYNSGARIIRAMPTFHPAYLLRSPLYKRLAWQDLRAIRKALQSGS